MTQTGPAASIEPLAGSWQWHPEADIVAERGQRASMSTIPLLLGFVALWAISIAPHMRSAAFVVRQA
jgi:hypothetical protein